MRSFVLTGQTSSRPRCSKTLTQWMAFFTKRYPIVGKVVE